jgi:hypothetical protein
MVEASDHRVEGGGNGLSHGGRREPVLGLNDRIKWMAYREALARRQGTT